MTTAITTKRQMLKCKQHKKY